MGRCGECGRWRALAWFGGDGGQCERAREYIAVKLSPENPVLIGGYGHLGWLCTHKDFGCVCFENKEVK
jgi:hypothetical protein